ncbi:DNA modification system-associated small protein [uncultured Tenacibaculum sp.]|uniref:DNA modification system-associated small protein n=1 Tax=uncultured Tenacibaculum sp. TaxID=174713 RepID=UPI0026128379|nr:DNA modification system-associated small protein [uncultured Tenacibaculum sp.]
MKIQEIKNKQLNRLKEICEESDVSYSSISTLLESVKTKKLYKRNNYHLQTMNDEIEKAIK